MINKITILVIFFSAAVQAMQPGVPPLPSRGAGAADPMENFARIHRNEHALLQAVEAYLRGGLLQRVVDCLNAGSDLAVRMPNGMTMREHLDHYAAQSGPQQPLLQVIQQVANDYQATGRAQLPANGNAALSDDSSNSPSAPVADPAPARSVPTALRFVQLSPNGGDPREVWRQQHPNEAEFLDALKKYDRDGDNRDLLNAFQLHVNYELVLSPATRMPKTQLSFNCTVDQAFQVVNQNIERSNPQMAAEMERISDEAFSPEGQQVRSANQNNRGLQRRSSQSTALVADGIFRVVTGPRVRREPRLVRLLPTTPSLNTGLQTQGGLPGSLVPGSHLSTVITGPTSLANTGSSIQGGTVTGVTNANTTTQRRGWSTGAKVGIGLTIGALVLLAGKVYYDHTKKSKKPA
jgi:hypothetical protein